MRASASQIAGFTLVSALFIVFVYALARRSRLSFRCALEWILLFVPGILAMVCLILTTPISNALAITPAVLLAMSFMAVLVAIRVQLSISISSLQERVRNLSEEVAQLCLSSEFEGDEWSPLNRYLKTIY
jgi:hypothetical protein